MTHCGDGIQRSLTAINAGRVDAARAPKAAAVSAQGLTPTVMAQAIEKVIHRHDANWSDEAIPALGGPTPSHAITAPTGRERVEGLRREYENGEQRQSAAQGESAVFHRIFV
ncbi:MAG: hypothetical protein KGL99_07160 [Burkholderiales bacterium]|nr:hypothetical protein [Burkholderiales bacterium]